MAMIHVSGTMVPERSFTGQKRMWCPRGPGQPLLMSGVALFKVSSLDSAPSSLNPNTGPGVNVPLARAVEPLACGRTVCASVAAEVTIELSAPGLPLLNQYSVAVWFWLWYASICVTDTGFVVLATSQYGDRTSSPTAVTRPSWFSTWFGPTMTVP